MLKGAACARRFAFLQTPLSRAEKDTAGREERIARNGGGGRGRKREEGNAKGENVIRVKKKNRARARVQSTRASRESTGSGRPKMSKERENRDREEERKRSTFSSGRVEAPVCFCAARVSRRQLVQSLQNVASAYFIYRIIPDASFPRDSFLFHKRTWYPDVQLFLSSNVDELFLNDN